MYGLTSINYVTERTLLFTILRHMNSRYVALHQLRHLCCSCNYTTCSTKTAALFCRHATMQLRHYKVAPLGFIIPCFPVKAAFII